MGIRKAVATVGTAIGMAALGAAAAGNAGAVVTEFDPGVGIYGALDLSHQETVALNNSPIPGLLDPLWAQHGLYDTDPASRLDAGAADPRYTAADFSDVVREAAVNGGTVSFGIVDPVRLYDGNIWPGQENRNFLIVQFL
ncbi:hypothetical protein ACTD5D_37015 [Nocardia takedensis]|uniref:hypothetical protein n=1 Tax=Nocardia takedensis TaxID=259390 RepID=UPI0002D48C1F|nr:hypothetical protein [Nocardia takedensis]